MQTWSGVTVDQFGFVTVFVVLIANTAWYIEHKQYEGVIL